MANSCKKIKEFNERDSVMIKLRPERFSLGTMKKLHARGAGPFKIIKKIRPNAYVLELSSDYGISSIFNIFDLKEYKKPTLIPSEAFGPYLAFESKTLPKYPPAIPPD